MPRKPSPPPQDPSPGPTGLRESAQQIWMAGLSAFAKAQTGGNKVFEALMKEGEALQSKTRRAAREQVDDMAGKATGTWDKLEQVFESRVAQALHSLGVPTQDEVQTLSRRVAELSALVQALQAGASAPAAPRVKAAKAVKADKTDKAPKKRRTTATPTAARRTATRSATE